MKVTIMVARQPAAGANSFQCQASFETDSLDQQAVSHLIHTAQQCDAVVRQSSSQQPMTPITTGNNNGFTAAARPKHRVATDKQCGAIKSMSKRQGIDLGPILHDEFNASSVSALSISQASELIDRLKGNLQSA